jgi:hypothetical protein
MSFAYESKRVGWCMFANCHLSDSDAPHCLLCFCVKQTGGIVARTKNKNETSQIKRNQSYSEVALLVWNSFDMKIYLADVKFKQLGHPSTKFFNFSGILIN